MKKHGTIPPADFNKWAIICEHIIRHYNEGWADEYLYSIESIHSLKNSAFIMSCICEAQASSIDMLMYYDTRSSCFNGIFDFYSYKPLHGYYSMYWYGMFYDMKA